MRRPRSLALAIASFLLGSRALEMKSEIGLLPRSLENRQSQLATCTYTASYDEKASTKENQYTFVIDLPGVWWRSVCHENKIMQPTLDTIELRCRQTWSWKSLRRRFKRLEAIQGEDLCRIELEIFAESAEDESFPGFLEDCILRPKPEPCGFAAAYFPWPSVCVSDRVGLHMRVPHIIRVTSPAPAQIANVRWWCRRAFPNRRRTSRSINPD